MTAFYLIRHAERDTASDFLPGRAANIRLTERGRAQAELLARHLRGRPVDKVLSSPLERALDTAAPLATQNRLEVERVAAFNEMDFGNWTGMRVAELVDDEQWKWFNRFRSGTRIPGGETALEVQHRFTTELIRLRDEFPGKRIACFSHADPIRLALVYFLGAPLDCFDRIQIDVGSVTELVLAEWGARVVRLNEVPAE